MQQKPAQQDAPPIVGVIDPDPVARNGLSTLLHGLGIDVSTFDSAESFLLATSGRHVGCLIVDLLLPGMSGLELLRRLRSEGTLRGATLIALTGFGQDEDSRHAADAGFDHHLVKPVDPLHLRVLLNSVASGSHTTEGSAPKG